jgi:starch phosphorylase
MNSFRGIRPNHFKLPEQISKLSDLAYNLWWVWEKEAQRLFTMIDAHLWEETYHNPIKFFHQVERARLNAVTYDPYYMEFYEKTMAAFESYLASKETWFHKTYPEQVDNPIAYFSSEFGLHETLPIYAGGLGVLSGDHLKEASDLGLPLVAVGFMYTHGYFSQHITEDGWQEARQVDLMFEDLPVIPLFDKDGKRLQITVKLIDREVNAQLWEINVGRVPLYLLDTNVEDNNEADRELSSRRRSSRSSASARW